MDAIINLMKSKGQRVTAQKLSVLRALQNKPQTVQEMYTALISHKSDIDKATVYRILTCFVELGVVRQIYLQDREVRYELTDSSHHHHLVCTDCGGIEDIEFNETNLLKEVSKQTRFTVVSHSLEFFGICSHCK